MHRSTVVFDIDMAIYNEKTNESRVSSYNVGTLEQHKNLHKECQNYCSLRES